MRHQENALLKLVTALVLASFVYTTGAVAWLDDKISELATVVTNHHKHKIEEIEARIKSLEGK